MRLNEIHYHPEKKWVPPESFVMYGHCAPCSFTSYKFFILCPMPHAHSYATVTASPCAVRR